MKRYRHRFLLALWALGMGYLLSVAAIGWGPWDKNHQYTYTLPRSVAVAALVVWIGLFAVVVRRWKGRRLGIALVCVLLAGAVTAVALNEERGLRTVLKRAERLELSVDFVGDWAPGVRGTRRIHVATITDRAMIQTLGDALQFKPGSFWQGTFFFNSPEMTVKVMDGRRMISQIGLFNDGEGLRWLWMNDDVILEPAFAEVFSTALLDSLPADDSVSTESRWVHYFALGWTRQPEAMRRLASESRIRGPKEREQIAWKITSAPESPEAVAALIRLANDETSSVRNAALGNLRAMDKHAEVHTFLSALREENESDTDTRELVRRLKERTEEVQRAAESAE